MTTGIKLGQITDEIGSSDFLYSFFSTIAGNLEPDGWGSRFPTMMKTLYAGRLERRDVQEALRELDEIASSLQHMRPDQVIWDYEDRARLPPWGSDISGEIENLGNYFVTSTGRQLVPLIREIFVEAMNGKAGEAIEIVSY
ncbi:Imm70 family immunity protein [Stenotrophomonas bentonitica]|uniref:Imm70 family immunity protein n=1 Tax=Stenotrophomonas bentonitica TaxID=1450134 RepID=UPI0037D60186